MLTLLQQIESISSCRDREMLGRIALRAAAMVLGGKAEVGLFRRSSQGGAKLEFVSGCTVADPVPNQWPELVNKALAEGHLATTATGGRIYGALLLRPSEISSDQVLLAFAVDSAELDDPAETIACLSRIYGNQISLLDYSELDTLTRLLNRKTFDETFDRLLSAPVSDDESLAAEERRENREQEAPAWLGVIDIDHFKRINDNFGHLFGDEVLLRVGDLMRKCFRTGDRLFRFGGEEFVVILNAESGQYAAAGFDRFRASVETYEFPQIGQVTCSVGFTTVSQRDVPTDVVGRADEALYFAKNHGRNRVCCYERLLADGAIAVSRVTDASASNPDIDALFN